MTYSKFSKNLILITIFTLGLQSCSNSSSPTSSQPLDSDVDKANLILLREEEKLARDVYKMAYNETGIAIFNNIASSEQQHMDQVLSILNSNEIDDPALAEVGEFSHEEYQTLYDDLVTQVRTSSLEALLVGATIEDLDIADIGNYINETSNQSVLNLYSSLQCGSRNHLRSFMSQIEAQGGSYSPQFISQKSFDDILGSDREQCGKN